MVARQASIEAFRKRTLLPGVVYLIEGFVVDVRECRPCPPGAVCPTCLEEYIVVSDALAQASDGRISERELLVFADSARIHGLERRQAYVFEVQVTERRSPSWTPGSVELVRWRRAALK